MRLVSFGILVFSATGAGWAQNTQGLIAGRISDAQTGRGIPGAELICTQQESRIAYVARCDPEGRYTLPSVSPGTYLCRAHVTDGKSEILYKPQETYGIALEVAGRMDLDFPLRLLADLYDQNLYMTGFTTGADTIVHVYAADLRTIYAQPVTPIEGQANELEATVSATIDSQQLSQLPLNGRDVYALLVTQPGGVADAATARGLGLSFNGQRPSASTFLVDGIENNNSLVTGPLAVIAPEAVQEYRVATNNFSAEYGRSSGYLANAITRAGGSGWHGLAYVYTKNAALNANGFQENLNGFPRPPLHEIQAGITFGGPLVPGRLFLSGAFEYLRSHSAADPAPYLLPAAGYPVPFNTAAGRLL